MSRNQQVYIVERNIWLNGVIDEQDLSHLSLNYELIPSDYELPKPTYYPKAQLRRLSPFSKVALSCLDFIDIDRQQFPLVFASRHGDLAKTVELIKTVAESEPLSPTQFALSVHNSTSGLFGIATNNTAPTTTISAGKNTFSMGLLEACLQATQDRRDVLFCYCDFPVPSEYSGFVAKEAATCIALKISPSPTTGAFARVEINDSPVSNDSSNEAFSFINYACSPMREGELLLKNIKVYRK